MEKQTEKKPWFIRSSSMPEQLPKEKDQELCQKYPNLYRERHTTRYGLRWGFQMEAGWFKLIDKTSAAIEAEILKEPEEVRPHLHALQIKQKFCGLRFYMHETTPAIDSIIFKAESEAGHTCELCGSEQGTLVYPPMELQMEIRGWRRRVCKEHFYQLAEEDSWWVWDKEVPEELKQKFEEHYWKHLK